MKDDVSRWTNTGDEDCPECYCHPGEEHLDGCRTGNRDVAQDTPDSRNMLRSAGKAYADKLRAAADIKADERELASWGFPREVVRRALHDSQLSEDVRSRYDSAYAIARSALGCPIQLDAFSDE